jgi:hypothetical protein
VCYSSQKGACCVDKHKPTHIQTKSPNLSTSLDSKTLFGPQPETPGKAKQYNTCMMMRCTQHIHNMEYTMQATHILIPKHATPNQQTCNALPRHSVSVASAAVSSDHSTSWRQVGLTMNAQAWGSSGSPYLPTRQHAQYVPRICAMQ